jgi:hypothetical protein
LEPVYFHQSREWDRDTKPLDRPELGELLKRLSVGAANALLGSAVSES